MNHFHTLLSYHLMMADLFDKAAKAKQNLEKEVVKEEIERKSLEIRQLALEY